MQHHLLKYIVHWLKTRIYRIDSKPRRSMSDLKGIAREWFYHCGDRPATQQLYNIYIYVLEFTLKTKHLEIKNLIPYRLPIQIGNFRGRKPVYPSVYNQHGNGKSTSKTSHVWWCWPHYGHVNPYNLLVVFPVTYSFITFAIMIWWPIKLIKHGNSNA